MRFKKGSILLMIIFSTLVFFNSKISMAAEAEDPFGFSVETVIPDTQIDKDKTYFYIQTKPGEKQELHVKVSGNSEEGVKVKSFISNSITSELGTINYLPGKPKDESLKDSIEEIVTVSEPEFSIKKGEVKDIVITVNPPADSFSGIKLGSVYFERVNDESDAKQTAIDKSLSYRIGIMLAENDEEYSDSKTLNLNTVKPELLRKRKSIILNFQNPEPKMIADLNMKVQIVDEKGKVLKSQELEKGAVAPNTNFNFAVDWGIDIVPTGKYKAKVSATSRHESWQLEKSFEITQEQADKMNKETLVKLAIPFWGYVLIVSLAILTILVTIFLIIRRKKWYIEYKKKKKKKKGGKK